MTAGEPANGMTDLILELARELGASVYTPAEVEQIRRQLLARFGAEGSATVERIAEVLQAGGLRVRRPQEEGAQRYDEEFRDLLRFATLEDAELCLVRLDDLLRKFRAQGDRTGEERVFEVARLGRRRAMMIARNARVDAEKRAEKTEVARWFEVWLRNPEAFFDWLELRKQAPEFRQLFGGRAAARS